MANHHHAEISIYWKGIFQLVWKKVCLLPVEVQPLSCHPRAKGLHFVFQPIDAKQRGPGFCQTKLDYEK